MYMLTIRECRLEFNCDSKNSHKFYVVELLKTKSGMYHVTRRYGRIGNNSKSTIVLDTACIHEAHSKADSLISSKLHSKKDKYIRVYDRTNEEFGKVITPKQVKPLKIVIKADEKPNSEIWAGMKLT